MWSDVDFLADAPVREVVGVVGNVRQAGLYEPAMPQIYLPQAQVPWPWYLSIIVKRSGDPREFVTAIQARLRSIDPSLAFGEITTLEEVKARSLATPRFLSLMTSGFSTVGLLLALLGTYAFVALSVENRRRELGIRAAVGATSADLTRLVLSHAAGLGIAGVALGAVLALALTRLLSSLLFAISPSDPSIYIVIGAFLASVTPLAAWVPARRASQTDPANTLRRE